MKYCPKCSSILKHHVKSCHCGHEKLHHFKNDDKTLLKEIKDLIKERRKHGLTGLVGDLNCVIINVEKRNLEKAAQDLINTTGLKFNSSFSDDEFNTIVLKNKKGADFLIRSRKKLNPFKKYNQAKKAKKLPNTRLETFVFECKDIYKYYDIQKMRGHKFMSKVLEFENYYFVQTTPSKFTNNSIGFVQWKRNKGNWITGEKLKVKLKPKSILAVKHLDHTATRVKAQHRDAAILEFLSLTNYNFDKSIYVKSFNSITNVCRLKGANFAMVVTSGINPFVSIRISGPTEKFISNYGPRVHHMAFKTFKILSTYELLKKRGMKFLVELVGGKSEGLYQTFSQPSKYTMLVNEYIYRFGKFDGFFTKSNVTKLTAATDMQ